MKNGYRIKWTPNALEELSATFEYLEENFTQKEISNLAAAIEHTTSLLSQNPNLFQESEFENIRRTVVLKFNTIYYRIMEKEVQILSFFSNRQNPDERKV